MKSRPRTPPSNKFYSNEPAVATKQMADKPIVQNSGLGGGAPKSVDKKPGRMSGFAGFVDKGHPKKGNSHIPAVPKLGTPAKSPPKQGSLKPSGHSGAHQLGVKKFKPSK